MEWLAVVGVIVSVLLGAAVVVLSVMLSSARQQAASLSRDAPNPLHVPVPVSRPGESPPHDGPEPADRELSRTVDSGEVILFRLTLDSDRLSSVSLFGFRRPGAPSSIRFESALERIHEEDRSMFRNSVIDAITRQRPLELVFRMLQDDAYHYFHLRARTNPGSNPGSVDLAGALADISALMLAQREQDDWLKNLEELEDVLPYGVWAFDENGIMTVWNRAVTRLTGIAPESVVGFDRDSIRTPGFMAVVRPLDDSGRGDEIYRTVVASPDGTLHLRVTPVRIRREGRVAHTFGIVTEDGPVPQGGKAGEMEALGRLTAEVAHDFANLVHIIMGYADIVAQDLGDNERLLPPFLMDDIGQIQNAAARADDLVRQLLVFCSRESLNTAECDLNDVVKHFSGLMTRILGEEIALRFHPRADLQAALADPGMVERILLKLLLRLKDTLPEGGVVAMSTMNVTVEPDWPVGDLEPADYVKLSISTDTVGWGRENQDNDGDGESVARMMTAAGGHLNLHESPDLGTTVSLYFKTGRTTSTATDAGGMQSSQTDESVTWSELPTRRATILVVEDDTPVRRLTAKSLAQAGHVVLEAADGTEAVSVFNADPDRIDLLITDVIMPGMNGRQVCDELKRSRPDLPVLFCSGYSSDLLRNEYMLNIQGLVIQKPYRSSDLVAAAARLLAASPARSRGTPGDAGNA